MKAHLIGGPYDGAEIDVEAFELELIMGSDTGSELPPASTLAASGPSAPPLVYELAPPTAAGHADYYYRTPR